MNSPYVPYHSENQVEANGLKINFDSFGDPSHPPMIMIMGLGAQMLFWDENLCKLLASQGFWVIRFDNRDIGKSTWLKHLPAPSLMGFLSSSLFGRALNAPYLLSDMADDTLGLMDALQLDKANIVGASMGGMIAQCVALKARDRVVSLTSIMSTTGNRSLPKPKARVGMALMRPMPKNIDQYVEHGLSVWKMLHTDNFPFDAERMENVLRSSREIGFNPAGLSRQLAAIIDSPDRTEQLNNLMTPSLVIHGDQDPLVPVECGYATAEALPNSSLKILKGMGHTLPEQLWSEITAGIVDLARSASN
ncbi:MAG: alpha/beta fold hydrolase [Kangiellaceae bacterium]